MRILPRSVRGTWLLAAAVWVGLCAAAWWATPPRPRAVITVPGDNSVLGVGPGGRIVTILEKGAAEGDRVLTRVWDTAGASLRTVVDAKNVMGTCAHSPDGQWLVAGLGAADRNRGVVRLRIWNLVTGDEEEWAGPAGAPQQFEPGEFSPDGRWLAFADQDKDGETGLRLWDLERQQPGPRFSANPWPLAFTPDGRRMASSVHVPDAPDGILERIVVWDVVSRREIARIPYQPSYRITAMTADGTGLIGESSFLTILPIPIQIKCWNITNGSERWSIEDVDQFLLTASGRRLVAMRHNPKVGAAGISIIDAESGREVSQYPIDANASVKAASRDGQTLMIRSNSPIGFDAVRLWLAEHIMRVFQTKTGFRCYLMDVANGRRLLTLQDGTAACAPDGQSFAFISDERPGIVELWDIPPRKPLRWFALASAILALPLAGLAWHRSRRLRR